MLFLLGLLLGEFLEPHRDKRKGKYPKQYQRGYDPREGEGAGVGPERLEPQTEGGDGEGEDHGEREILIDLHKPDGEEREDGEDEACDGEGSAIALHGCGREHHGGVGGSRLEVLGGGRELVSAVVAGYGVSVLHLGAPWAYLLLLIDHTLIV